MPKWAELDGNGILKFFMEVLEGYKKAEWFEEVISLQDAFQVKTSEELKVSPIFELC
jgi:hypothetical protein